MNFLRKSSELSHRLAHMQAMIFEKSVEEGYPSKMFIKCFLLSSEALSLDNLELEKSGINQIDIFDAVKSKIKSKRGELLSFPIMHFIGYFYRMASYLSGYTSRKLYELIGIDILVRNYLTLHTLPIEESIQEIFDILKIPESNLNQKFMDIYKKYSSN